MRIRRRLLHHLAFVSATLGGGWTLVGHPAAQAPAPAFEVASVKVNKSGSASAMRLMLDPGGRFTATSVTLQDLIRSAYARQPFERPRVEGGPSWLASERFDIVARAPGNHVLDSDGTPRQTFLMLRTLLVERFRLRIHDERREVPVFALVFARRDERLGPNLLKSTVDCAAVMEALRNGQRPPIEPGKGPPCSFGGPPGTLVGTAVSIAQFANVLSSRVERPVIDRTGLAGGFDLNVEWSLTDDGVSIFTALQEQLGLKLEPSTGPVDVLVIDGAEMPTEN